MYLVIISYILLTILIYFNLYTFKVKIGNLKIYKIYMNIINQLYAPKHIIFQFSF